MPRDLPMEVSEDSQTMRIRKHDAPIPVVTVGTQGPPGPAALGVGDVVGTDAEIVEYVGATPTAVKHRAHHGVVIAASTSPAWMKRMADYVCDGTADQVQWQAANDEAMSYESSYKGIFPTAYPPLIVLPGFYSFNAQMNWENPVIIGPGSTFGAIVSWDGSAGGTPFKKVPEPAGGCSWGGMRGLGIWSTETAQAGALLDFTDCDFIDSNFFLDDIHFNGGDVNIDMNQWVNLHWTRLRFDRWNTWMIRAATIAAGQIFGSFHISDFTVDTGPDTGTDTQQGMMLIDDTLGNSADMGTVRFSDARIEFNRPLDAAGPQTLIQYTTASGTGFGLHLDGVSFQDANTPANSLVNITRSAGDYPAVQITLDNFKQIGLVSIEGDGFGGAYSKMSMKLHYGHATNTFDVMHGFNGTPDYTDNLITSRSRTDAYDRFQVTALGEVYIGPGFVAPTKALGDGFLHLSPVTLPATCAVGDICVDNADKKVKICTATNTWTIVGSQ